jgi:hypothetical protein
MPLIHLRLRRGVQLLLMLYYIDCIALYYHFPRSACSFIALLYTGRGCIEIDGWKHATGERAE